MNNNYRGVRPSTAKKNTLPPETENIEEYMKILYDHQKACEKAGKYLEADCAKQRLKDVRIQYEARTKVDIKDRHEQEKYDLTKSHQEEMQNFNAFWEGKFQEFEEEAQKLKNEQQQKQEDELQQFLQELENSIPLQPKDSAELLSLRKTEEQLAKHEEYLEAHKIQQRIVTLQQEEIDKWTYSRNNKIKNLIQQLKVKQANEINALNQRIQNASDEQKKIKKAEEEKMIQKYNNIKKELDSKQVQEVQKVEKNFKNSSSIYSMSRMSKMEQSVQEEKQ